MERCYSCDICGKSFYKINQLNQHLIIHKPEDEKPFRCATCNKAFNRSHHLKVHLMTHTKEGPYVCDFCGHRCCQPSDLKKHQMLHTGERPYSCPVCGKGFIQVGAMRSHMRTHEKQGMAPLNCQICSCTFNTVKGLEKHLLSHTTEHPFVCDICGKKFAQETKLKQHAMSHSEKDTYKCKSCGKVFKKLPSLEKHLETHWKEYRFKCDICEKEFQKEGAYKRHLKIHSPSVSEGQLLTVDLEMLEPDNLNFLPTETTSNAMYDVSSHNLFSQPTSEVLFIDSETPTYSGYSDSACSGYDGNMVFFVDENNILHQETCEFVTDAQGLVYPGSFSNSDSELDGNVVYEYRPLMETTDVPIATTDEEVRKTSSSVKCTVLDGMSVVFTHTR